jgi:hypothetical protein
MNWVNQRKWALAFGVFLYLWLVRVLKQRRLRFLKQMFERGPHNYFFILRLSAFNSYPLWAEVGGGFGFFRTFAIPSISKILCKTGQFNKNPIKRYDDTELLIREFSEHHYDSERGQVALRRLNYIHSNYKIRNEDFLYTLGVFVFTQEDFGDRTSCFQGEAVELFKTTNFLYWCDIARRMGIQNVPDDRNAFRRWYEAFEQREMVYAPTNREVADAALAIVDRLPVPSFIHRFAKNSVVALMDERLRRALGYDKPNRLLVAAVRGLVYLQSLVQEYCLPPRTLDASKLRTPREPGGCPRFSLFPKSPYVNGYRTGDLGPASISAGQLGPLYGPGFDQTLDGNTAMHCPYGRHASNLNE